MEFPSNKLWNETETAYIEIGLSRLPLFYEKGSSGTSFTETVGLPIDILTYKICRTLKDKESPEVLLHERHDLAVEALTTLDKTYRNFLRIIDSDSIDENHKAKLLDYTTRKHNLLIDKISKYVIAKDVEQFEEVR